MISIEEIQDTVSITPRPTIDEVDFVLGLIDKPGKSRDTKQDYIRKLYPTANNFQNIHIAKYMHNYNNY